jgi:hypothetical protein
MTRYCDDEDIDQGAIAMVAAMNPDGPFACPFVMFRKLRCWLFGHSEFWIIDRFNNVRTEVCVRCWERRLVHNTELTK